MLFCIIVRLEPLALSRHHSSFSLRLRSNYEMFLVSPTDCQMLVPSISNSKSLRETFKKKKKV